MEFLRDFDDFLLLDKLPLLVKETGLNVYDFRFRDALVCHSVVNPTAEPILLRIGAISDFAGLAVSLADMGMSLLFSEEQHNQVSYLENWYPLLQAYTPFSSVYDDFPAVDALLQDFSFPVFIKGSRQTNHHKKNQCIIESIEMYNALRLQWNHEKQLHWQKIAIREFVPLQKIDDTSYPDMIPFSYEFRIFFWKRQMVGCGRYWMLGQVYELDAVDREPAMALAQKAAELVDVPFLAVDIAKTQVGNWIVVEVNDGQESGYAGVNPVVLWQNILQVECGNKPVL